MAMPSHVHRRTWCMDRSIREAASQVIIRRTHSGRQGTADNITMVAEGDRVDVTPGMAEAVLRIEGGIVSMRIQLCTR